MRRMLKIILKVGTSCSQQGDKYSLIILKQSSWLRDALSELDPSCDKLTFIGNPSDVPDAGAHTARQRQRARLQAQPNFRIEATGTFGNTEVGV